MNNSIAAIALLSLSLTGCVSPYVPPSPPPAPLVDLKNVQDVKKSVTVKRDDFKKTTTYVGPEINRGGTSTFLRSWKNDKDAYPSYQIYVTTVYDDDWRFYDTAYDSNGNRLDVLVIDREVLKGGCSKYGCVHTEDVAFTVSKEYLEKNIQSGITFKLNGRTANAEIIQFIPGAYIEGFLSAEAKKLAAK
ncbi:MAG: hypothetical protein Q8K74_13390 [Candidatus Nitrotoga sp.]|nr:hypothetical protein [Candidatus Nitrotoga sp.]MDP1857006.1 hypothetical protein [Candidatus Nitrotoga sp.]